VTWDSDHGTDAERVDEVLVQVVRRTRTHGRRTSRDARSRTIEDVCAYSRGRTQPAWGQSGTRTSRSKVTAKHLVHARPDRQQSSWQTSIEPSLQELLDTTPVLDVLAGGDAHRGESRRG